jgi:hypothetical protein
MKAACTAHGQLHRYHQKTCKQAGQEKTDNSASYTHQEWNECMLY